MGRKGLVTAISAVICATSMACKRNQVAETATKDLAVAAGLATHLIWSPWQKPAGYQGDLYCVLKCAPGVQVGQGRNAPERLQICSGGARLDAATLASGLLLAKDSTILPDEVKPFIQAQTIGGEKFGRLSVTDGGADKAGRNERMQAFLATALPPRQFFQVPADLPVEADPTATPVVAPGGELIEGTDQQLLEAKYRAAREAMRMVEDVVTGCLPQAESTAMVEVEIEQLAAAAKQAQVDADQRDQLGAQLQLLAESFQSAAGGRPFVEERYPACGQPGVTGPVDGNPRLELAVRSGALLWDARTNDLVLEVTANDLTGAKASESSLVKAPARFIPKAFVGAEYEAICLKGRFAPAVNDGSNAFVAVGYGPDHDFQVCVHRQEADIVSVLRLDRPSVRQGIYGVFRGSGARWALKMPLPTVRTNPGLYNTVVNGAQYRACDGASASLNLRLISIDPYGR